MRRMMLPAVFAACLFACPAFAQGETAPAAAPAAQACELHVWPGSDLIHLYYGWFHGGTIDGSVKNRQGYPDAPENPLTAQVQVRLLANMDLSTLMALPGYEVIVHPQSLTSREIRASTTRLAESSSPCYAELMVDDLLLTQNVIGGNALRASFRFRDFGPDAAPRRMFGTFAMTKLTLFPPDAQEDMPTASAELQQAFTSNVKQFITALRKPPRRR